MCRECKILDFNCLVNISFLCSSCFLENQIQMRILSITNYLYSMTDAAFWKKIMCHLPSHWLSISVLRSHELE